ncbi:MAG: hypothetical protein AAGI07_07765 [Bacteroidota bacterium]
MQTEVEKLKADLLDSKITNFKQKALKLRNFKVPEGLHKDDVDDYLLFLDNKLDKAIKENFEFEFDARGEVYAKDKSGKLHTNIPGVIGELIAGSGVKFEDTKGSYNLPDISSNKYSNIQEAQQRLESEMSDKGIWPSDPRYIAAEVQAGIKELGKLHPYIQADVKKHL